MESIAFVLDVRSCAPFCKRPKQQPNSRTGLRLHHFLPVTSVRPFFCQNLSCSISSSSSSSQFFHPVLIKGNLNLLPFTRLIIRKKYLCSREVHRMDRQPLLARQAYSASCQSLLSNINSNLHVSSSSALFSSVLFNDFTSSDHHRNLSPGMDFLTMLDKLLVKQKLQMTEILTGIEMKNQYCISSSNGEMIFSASEESNLCDRNCCPGSIRPFDMRIQDTRGRDVMMFSRRLACDSCCFPCSMQRMEITSPPGTVIGYILQEWSLFHPQFRVEDPSGEIVMRIEGPFWKVSCGESIDFSILSKDESLVIGKIRKMWSGLSKEVFSDAEHYEITFPLDLDIHMKSVILGACFLIDFMYYENV